MPRTLWGIVYGTARPHIRQHVLLDDDSHYASYTLSPGEKLILVDYVEGERWEEFIQRINSAVEADCGQPVQELKFVEVDRATNTIVHVHAGDVAFYHGDNLYVDLPAHLHAEIGHGHGYDPETGEFVVPEQILPAKVSRPTAVVVLERRLK